MSQETARVHLEYGHNSEKLNKTTTSFSIPIVNIPAFEKQVLAFAKQIGGDKEDVKKE